MRLKELMPYVGDADSAALNAELARRFRTSAFDAAVLARATAHVKQTLLEKLNVNNPRFETAMDIEGVT